MHMNIEEAVQRVLGASLEDLRLVDEEKLKKLRGHLSSALRAAAEEDNVKSLSRAIESSAGWKKVEELNEKLVKQVFDSELDQHRGHLALTHIERTQNSAPTDLQCSGLLVSIQRMRAVQEGEQDAL